MVRSIAFILLAATVAVAAPRANDARAHFDRGIAAYSIADYAVAARELGASFAIEADQETLYAWAQTERNLGNCVKAMELYGKLLQYEQPDENKREIDRQLRQCKTVPATAKPPQTEPLHPALPQSSTEQRAWWKDPVGGTLIGVGVISVGVAGVMFVQARNADRNADDVAADSASTYPQYVALRERAGSRANLAVISGVAGIALMGFGVVWYATRDRPSGPTLSGWLSPSTGGLGVSSTF